MVRRFFAALGIALLLQGTVFAIYYDDLLYLRQSADTIVSTSPEVFTQHAERALNRSRLTRKHLDTIADSARAFDLHAIEITALERRTSEDPSDRTVRLRLADALRRGRQFSRAETLYLDVLASHRDQTP